MIAGLYGFPLGRQGTASTSEESPRMNLGGVRLGSAFQVSAHSFRIAEYSGQHVKQMNKHTKKATIIGGQVSSNLQWE